nr:TlpA disulfide reductase family protein [uncultured Flavobacterium sp.]
MDLKGKVILLIFGFGGWLPCLKATPDLIKLQEEFKNDLVVIGINNIDNKEDISSYYAYKKNINYLSTYKALTNISKGLKVGIFQTFVIINCNGEIVKVVIGFNKGSVRKTIKKLIRQTK